METLESVIAADYKHGFVTDIEADTFPPGLSEDTIRALSAKKNEPEWMLEYRLKAFRHWLTLVEPHRPAIEQGLGESILPVIVSSFDDFMGARWEEAVREHVRIEASAGRLLPEAVAVGEFWKTQAGPTDDPCQLDIVALVGRSRKVALAGEVKWGAKQSAPALVANVRRKVEQARLDTVDDVQWLVAARDLVTRVPSGVLSVTAHEVFA